ncbi:alpha-galactosidase [Pullulanibacillus pueri]|uniref:Alpha-galactosidase n=1 Tax=Pullulanibacillus pueri TaxID=1437324 RepID=A0A8J3ENK7_9BACL|nr:alpha-galactosidase [Pullulanibacillus pueri]MBM7683303.1 alpha-galactosidase [Pullulanibacillus pueri]GGH86454.1 hypothetical protein GCM10007096_34200 [Pullulanibacillus pueri]
MSFLSICQTPDKISVETDINWIDLDRSNTNEWDKSGIEVHVPIQNKEMRIFLSSQSDGIKRIMIRWNRAVSSQLQILGDHWERGYGDLEWRGIVPERILPWYFLTYDHTSTHGYGVKTGPNSLCFWQIDSSGVSLCLDVRNGGKGVQLGHRQLHAASIVERRGRESEKPFVAVQRFCQLLCESPRLPKVPIYGGNNWYYAYGNSSHDEILDDTKLIASLASNADNRPFMVIDDGWQICHSKACNGGPWFKGNYKFPDMEKLATQIKEIGARPGIWMRPMLTTESIPSSWILQNQNKQQFSFDGQVMDPSVEGVLEFIFNDVRRLSNWGYELIKHDFSTYDIFGRWGFEMGEQITHEGWSFSNPMKTTAEIILELYQTIRVAAGESLVIGCNTISHLAAGIMDIQRTGDDTSGKEWERTRKYGINTLAFRMPQHKTFYAVDADCVGITKEIPWSLNSKWLDLLSRSGTPLFISADPDAVGKEQKRAIKNAFEWASRPLTIGEPLDWLNTTCPVKWSLNGERASFDWFNQ